MNLSKSAMTAIAVLTLFTTACSKSNDAPPSTPAADNGGLKAAMSQAGAQKAAIAALPQANKDTPIEQYVKIDSGNQLMFAYYAFSGLPIDYEKIAGVYSQDYRQTADEFKKRDILTAIKPRIDAEIAKIKEQRYFKFESDVNLSHYDFDKKSFAVNDSLLGNTGFSYFYDNPTYRLSVTNGEQFRRLNVPDENQARAIEKMVNDRSGLNMQLYLYAQDVDTSNSTVKFQIVKIKLTDRQGGELLSQ